MKTLGLFSHRDDETEGEWHRRLQLDPNLESCKSALSALLKNNNEPDEDQIRIIREFRRKHFKRLDAIEGEVERLGNILQSYRTICDEIEDESDLRKVEADSREKDISACDIALSPFRRLPFDVLQEIAMWCLPMVPSFQKQRDAPRSLSHVSSIWRKAVLCLPNLWSKFHVQARSRFADCTTEYLRRAQDLPLSLSFSLYQDKSCSVSCSRLDAKKFMNWMLFRSGLAGKVEYLSVDSDHSLNEIMMSDESPDLPMLECLVLCYHQPQTTTLPGKLLLQAPNLKRLIVGTGIITQDPANLSIPWGQLTYLFLGGKISASDWIALLDKCINLEIGRFFVSETSHTFNSTGQVQATEHKTLQDLVVRFYANLPTSFSGILGCQSFPAVTQLKLMFYRRYYDYNEPLSSPFALQATFPNLHDVSLYLGPSSPLPYVEFFRENPQITTLCITADLSESKALCHALTIHDLRNVEILKEVPLPHLTSFHLRLLETSEKIKQLSRRRAQQLVKMMQSRVPSQDDAVKVGITPLSFCHLIVSAPNDIAQEIKGNMKALGIHGGFKYIFNNMPFYAKNDDYSLRYHLDRMHIPGETSLASFTCSVG